MRALILPLLAASVLAAPAHAGLRLGVLGGPTFSRLTADEADFATSHRTGYSAGAVVAWDVNPSLSLELQPTFTSRGGKVRFVDDEAPFAGQAEVGAEARLTYFELPLLFKYALVTGDRGVRPYLLAGPTLGLRRGAEVLFAGQTYDAEPEVKKTDFGLGFGGGLRVPAGRASLFVEGQYTLGLTNVDVEPDQDSAATRSRGFQLKLGVTLPVFGGR